MTLAGSLIDRARRLAGLSQRALGARAGTSHATVSAYENGRKDPGTATVERLVGAAGFDLDVTLRPRPAPLDERASELLEVLDLAARFPARHEPALTAPVFGR